MPISQFLTPFYDSWPLSSYWWYDATGMGGPYWYTLCPGPNLNTAFLAAAPSPAKAYPGSYETGVKNVVRQFVEHAQAEGWWGTNIQFFLNNKESFGDDTRPHSQFWNLDEPSEGDGMEALGYFLGLFRQAVESADAPNVKCKYRLDVSTRTGMTRSRLDGKGNLWDCSLH